MSAINDEEEKDKRADPPCSMRNHVQLICVPYVAIVQQLATPEYKRAVTGYQVQD